MSASGHKYTPAQLFRRLSKTSKKNHADAAYPEQILSSDRLAIGEADRPAERTMLQESKLDTGLDHCGSSESSKAQDASSLVRDSSTFS